MLFRYYNLMMMMVTIIILSETKSQVKEEFNAVIDVLVKSSVVPQRLSRLRDR